MRRFGYAVLAVLTALASQAAPAVAGDAGYLLRQADLEVARLTGELPARDDDWGAGGEFGGTDVDGDGADAPVIPMLMSLLVPGAGEVYLGHSRGYLQIALDAASWYGALHYDGKGEDKKDEYYAYADEHWSLDRLAAGYDPSWSSDQPYWNPEYDAMAGDGLDYFPDASEGDFGGIDTFRNLPLWVSAEEDRREYYENLGKWDQFVFGWDDYEDPRNFLDTDDSDSVNLQDPRTSARREVYRDMRQKSNDYFNNRDRFIYLSIAFRLFSVLQVAYLEGLLFGDGADGGPERFEVSGHRIDFFAEPTGVGRGVMGARVSF
jgi:hypothetical protein